MGGQETPRRAEHWCQPGKQEQVRSSKGLRERHGEGKCQRNPLLPGEIRPHRHQQEGRRNLKEMLGRSCFTELSRNTKLQNLLYARPCSFLLPHLQPSPPTAPQLRLPRMGWRGGFHEAAFGVRGVRE